MRHLLSILISILFPTALVVAVLLALHKPGLPSSAKNILDQYLIVHSVPAPRSLEIQRVAQATLPWYFGASLGGITYSDGGGFRTNYSYPVATVKSPSSGLDISTPAIDFTSMNKNAGLAPLTYPPSDLWCVLITEQPGEIQHVVYLGLHEDMYIAGWVLHEPFAPQTREETQELLQKVGCTINL
jgi:hypothetical protein